LDFKYGESVTKRQHDNNMIESIIGVYLEKMKILFNFDENQQIPVYVFEKKAINRIHKNESVIVKDGIHLLIGVQCGRQVHKKLRELVLEDIGDFLNDLPLTNTLYDIVDDSVASGNSNWQLYGSKKPGNERYNLTYHYTCTLNEDNGFNLEKKNDIVKYKKNVADFKKLSAHYKGNLQPELKPSMIELLRNNSSDAYIINKSKRNVRIITREEACSIDNITSLEQLERTCETLLEVDIGNAANYKFKEAHNYLMIIDHSFSDSYKQWIEVGWALKGTDDRLFVSWMLFSAKSPKYSASFTPANIKQTVIEHYDRWNNFRTDDTCLTSKSIIFWAKSCYQNKTGIENKWEILHKSSIDYFIDESIKSLGSDYDMGSLIHCMYKEKYVLADHDKKIWFQYSKHRWNQNNACEPILKKLISSTIYDMLSDKMISVINSLNNMNLDQDSKEHKQLEERIHIISKIMLSCKNETKKTAMMISAKQLFIEPDFIQNADQNDKLLSFDNGVFDFEENVFRAGHPDDYITVGVNYDYIPIEKIHTHYKKEELEVREFLAQIYPRTELNSYMWELLASLLIGGNINQKFYIFIGKGSNGKSLVMELLGKVMGDYCGTLVSQYITSDRSKIGTASPELYSLKTKRVAIVNEPKKGEKLNDGVMKELTGGDIMTARGLFKDPITFRPKFKPIVCTNALYDINATDEGTWRRIDKVDHDSYFTDKNPDPTKNEFLKDKDKKNKFDSWKAVLMTLLVQIACKTKAKITPCEIVSASSNKYRNQQDSISKFINLRIVKEEGRNLKKCEVNEEFKIYLAENHTGNKIKISELYDVMENLFGRYKNGWKNVYLTENEDYNEDN